MFVVGTCGALGLELCKYCIQYNSTSYESKEWRIAEECIIQKCKKSFEYWMNTNPGLVRTKDNSFIRTPDLKSKLVVAVKYNTYPLDNQYYTLPMIKFYYPDIYNTIQKLLILK